MKKLFFLLQKVHSHFICEFKALVFRWIFFHCFISIIASLTNLIGPALSHSHSKRFVMLINLSNMRAETKIANLLTFHLVEYMKELVNFLIRLCPFHLFPFVAILFKKQKQRRV